MPKRGVEDVGALTMDEERLKAHMATRSGKWTTQEEQYAEVLVDYFRNGWLADCFDGTTLRVYLTIKLGCSPMRVSKKFSGKPLGQTYRKVCVSDEHLVILATLRKRFTDSVAQCARATAAHTSYPAAYSFQADKLVSHGFSELFGYPASLVAPSLRPAGCSSDDADALFIKEEPDMDICSKRSRGDSGSDTTFLTMDDDFDGGRASMCSAATDAEDASSSSSSCAMSIAGVLPHNSEENLRASALGFSLVKEESCPFAMSGLVWERLRGIDPLALQSSPLINDKDFLLLMDDLADCFEVGGSGGF